MPNQPIKFRNAILLTLTLGVLLGSFPLEALAQRFVPRDRGLPGRREGGATRGDCVAVQATSPDQLSLTALIPDKNLGLTTSTTPTLFWYVPENSANAAEFILMDDQDNEIYKARFQITGEAGIISLSLPEEAGLPPLQVGKDYHWSFSLMCATQDTPDNSGIIFTEGWIQRIEPDAALQQRLASATLEERPSIYAEAGIWQEAIASLATLRRTQPDNTAITARWGTLLESIGLGNLAAQPLMQRYQLAASQSAPSPAQTPQSQTPQPPQNSSPNSSTQSQSEPAPAPQPQSMQPTVAPSPTAANVPQAQADAPRSRSPRQRPARQADRR
ncbi:MAG: DUF928 domain-containing protein [Oculatellaceae cyanobacterium Prado106]|jgi:hypothetical protein|nr:DUF928 domain-containing protein [Oculatellaceae cyanobacterium Prado106]